MKPNEDGGDIAGLAAAVLQAAEGRERLIVAIAGPPGAGKSTVTNRLAAELAGAGASAAVVPMDGFHLDNAVLSARGHLPRRGAPFTFDAEGYLALIRRLRQAHGEVAVPVFDRRLDLARAGAQVVGEGQTIILTEGNYLLLDEAPWKNLADLFDLTVLVSAELEVLRQRLVQRWLDHGHEPEAARQRTEENDMANAELVLTRSRPADIVWRN